MPPIIISIEGNIGSGKSTLVAYLQEHYKGDSEVCFLQEPVNIWNSITDKEGNTIISKYYADQEKYAFSFQMMAYISRISLLKSALAKDYKVIVTERSVFTDANVFAKMLYDCGKLEEVNYKIYRQWFDEFINDLPKISLVYVKTTPNKCDQRVITRNREGEIIPIDYLEQCHKYHEKWIDTNNECLDILTLDGNQEITDSVKNHNIKQIKDFIALYIW